MSDVRDARCIKLRKIAKRLNEDAYALQSQRRKRVRRFTPCAKANVLVREMNAGCCRPTLQVLADAAQEECPCHSGWSDLDLLDLAFGNGT